MPQSSRTTIAVLLLCCAVACAAVSADKPTVSEQKRQIVQAALERNAAGLDNDLILRAADSAHALTGVEAEGTSGFRLLVSERPQYKVFALDGGRRLVVDLSNTINLRHGESFEDLDCRFVKAVRTSFYALRPEFVSRVVFDLTVPCTYRTQENENGVFIHLRPKSLGMAALEAIKNKGAASDNEITVAIITAKPATAKPVISSAQLTEALSRHLMKLSEQPSEPVTPEVAKPRPVSLRATQLTQALKSVAETEFTPDFPAIYYDAQVEAPELTPPAEPEVAEAGDTAEEAAEPPTPPAPRQQEPMGDTTGANKELVSKMRALRETDAGATETMAADVKPDMKAYHGDPLYQPVNIYFRDTDLSNVVSILATKAGINVVAGPEVTGSVTVDFRDVPLKQAMETVLRINGLGIMEKSGIYHIVPYEEAVLSERVTTMVSLENAKAEDVQKVVNDIIASSPEKDYISVSAHSAANMIVVSGPKSNISEIVAMVKELDIAEIVLPTVTEAIKLNYAEPEDMQALIEKMLTPDIGTVAADSRARHLIVTDVPAVLESIRALVEELDMPVRQVSIDAMVVDATLRDAAETGTDWILNAVRRQSRRQAALGDAGRMIGNLQDLGLATNLGLGTTSAGQLGINILSNAVDWRAVIQAEVRNDNSRLVSNPTLMTLENQPATITISQEIPYVELTQSEAGGQQTSTQFKDIGTVLKVTPRVTHDNHIFVELDAKESNTAGEFNGVPIENKRQIETSTLMRSGQTIYVGGLRKNNDDTSVKKVPVLGDIPVLNFMFRQNIRNEAVNELLIFLTCNVVEDGDMISAYQQRLYDMGDSMEMEVDAQDQIKYDTRYPRQGGKPAWEWRRSE